MTIVGEAELSIRAVGDQFTADINRVAKPGLASAGAAAEKTAQGMRSSFGAMWSAFGAQSQGALGPVAQVIDQIQSAASAIGKHASIAERGMVAGAVGTGVGVGLQALGSGELAAQQQLQMSIENLGKSYDDYDSHVEKTIKVGERHGHTAEDTLRVLNQLTIATKDPTKALADYSVVLDMAAVRHVPLQTAARMLSMVYAGNSRALKTFGIDLTAGTKALAAQKTATDAHTKAQEKLKTARQNLLDVEARINASRQGHAATQDQVASATARVASAEGAVATARFKHGDQSPQYATAVARLTAAEDHLTKVRGEGRGVTALTVSQQIELRKAHEAVRQAEQDVTTSAGQMATAHKDAAGAITSADGAIKLLAERVKGQADPSMNTFTGHLHAYWATAEDDLARFGNRWGGTVTAISTGVLATSTVLRGAQAVYDRFTATAETAAAAEASVGTSATTAASEVETGTATMAASGERNMSRLSGAVAGVIGIIGTVAVGSATAGSGTSGAVATTLTGAVSGAVVGLSVGGPFGAAVGGAVGALAGLATHFYDAGHQASQASKDIDQFGHSLLGALQADKYKAGPNVRGQINELLSKPAEAGNAAALSAAGVNMNQIVRELTQAGDPKGAQVQIIRAFSAQQIDATTMQQALAVLSSIVTQFASVQGQANAVASINGIITPDAARTSQGIRGLLDPGAPHPPGSGPSAPPTASQVNSVLMSLLAIQHNTAKGTHATEDLHTTVRTSERSRGAGARSPELMTL